MLRYGLINRKKLYELGASIERQSSRSATGDSSGGERCRLRPHPTNMLHHRARIDNVFLGRRGAGSRRAELSTCR
jgi:hypothetical protein